MRSPSRRTPIALSNARSPAAHRPERNRTHFLKLNATGSYGCMRYPNGCQRPRPPTSRSFSPLMAAPLFLNPGSVTGSCGVFMRYGRIRPLGSCGRRADAVVLAPGTGSRRGPPCPRRPMIRSRTGRSRAPCGCRSAIAARPLTCPSARRTGSYRGQGGKRGRRCRLRTRDCMGSPGLEDSRFRR
jgi:hypothetical protein